MVLSPTMIEGPKIYGAIREKVATHIELLHPDDSVNLGTEDDIFMGDCHKICCKKGVTAEFRLIFVPYRLNGSSLDTHHLVMVLLQNPLPDWTIVAHIRSCIVETLPTLTPIMNGFCREHCKNGHCALQGQAS